MVRGVGCVVFALAAGCASKQYYPFEYDAAALPAKRTVLLHPAVVRSDLPAPPADTLRALDAALIARFEAAGFVVDTSSTGLARLAPLTKQLPQPGARPVAESLARLGKDGVCDLVAFPTVEFRTCDSQNGECLWDGVIREMPTDQTVGMVTGSLPATSISVRVYACSGAEVFHSMGGLEVGWYATSEFTMGQTNASPIAGTGRSTIRFRVRNDYLSHPLIVEEAVALALHPLIAMDGYPKNPKFYDPTAPKRYQPRRGNRRKKEIFRGKATR